MLATSMEPPMNSPLAILKSLASGRESLPTAESQHFERTLSPTLDPPGGPVTDLLYERLTPEVAAVDARLTDEHRYFWEQASPDARKRWRLPLGFTTRRGGSRTDRPRRRRATGDGALDGTWTGGETGGSYILADMVLEALEEIGVR